MSLFGLLLSLLVFISWGTQSQASELRQVTVSLQWVHQAQFAGFYLAKDLGFYKQQGLSVKFLPGGAGIDPLKELASGHCRFAVSVLAEGLAKRAQGVKLVHLAQIIRQPAVLLVTFKNAGIEKLEDLSRRRVGLWSRDLSWAVRALLAKRGLKVREVRQGVSMEPFLRGAVEAASAMHFNEYHRLYQAGVNFNELRVFRPADFGLGFPEDAIYALESTWRSEPDLCRRFVKATLRGWQKAFAQPEAALDSVMKRVDASRLANNRTHQRWMLNSMQKLIQGGKGDKAMGSLSPNALESASAELFKLGMIARPVGFPELARQAWR